MRRALVLLLLGLAGGTRADDLDALAREFWAWRSATQPSSFDDIPRLERPSGWTPDWSAAAIADRRRRLEEFERRLAGLDAAGPVARQVDRRLMASALSRVRWELDVLRGWRRDPSFYLAQTLGALVECLLPPTPFDAARSAAVVRLLHGFPPTLSAAETNLDQAAAPFARLAIADLRAIVPRLQEATDHLKPRLDPAQAEPLDAATREAGVALHLYRSWLERRVGDMPADTAIGRDAYGFFLKKVALLPYAPEQLLAMGRQEWQRSVAFEALERQRNVGLPELPVFADQATQVARAARDELAIRRFLAEKDLLTVPASLAHYGYRPVPDYLAPLAGFGEWTEFTSPDRLDEDSTRYIPQPSRELGYFALSMAQDPRADMVHEGIPGHYFQLALAWSHADALRRHYYDSGPNEGIGFYCEEMMLQAGLFDDSPRTREMLYSYMRLRALRVEVDVKLALGDFTIEQAADYLRQAVPMDAGTARQEAANFAATPGQAITYQIGKLQILGFLADARRLQGEAFRLRSFHDFLFRNGNVPIALQRWEYLGLEDQVDALD